MGSVRDQGSVRRSLSSNQRGLWASAPYTSRQRAQWPYHRLDFDDRRLNLTDGEPHSNFKNRRTHTMRRHPRCRIGRVVGAVAPFGGRTFRRLKCPWERAVSLDQGGPGGSRTLTEPARRHFRALHSEATSRKVGTRNSEDPKT